MSNTQKVQTEHKHQTILVFILMFAFTATSMLAACQPILVNIAVNVLLPASILIACKLVFFERLKLTTLTLLRVLIIFAVFNVLNRQLFVNIVLIFLGINILEATFTDIFRYKRYLNGITGLALTASIIFLRGTWIDYTALSGELGLIGAFMHMYEFHAPAFTGTVCWIIAYTIWNWIFVTNEFSSAVSKLHIAILGAPILGCIITGNPNFWLAFRAGSLAFGGCFQIVEKEFVEKNLYSSSFERFVEATKKPVPQVVMMIINLALLATSCFYK